MTIRREDQLYPQQRHGLNTPHTTTDIKLIPAPLPLKLTKAATVEWWNTLRSSPKARKLYIKSQEASTKKSIRSILARKNDTGYWNAYATSIRSNRVRHSCISRSLFPGIIKFTHCWRHFALLLLTSIFLALRFGSEMSNDKCQDQIIAKHYKNWSLMQYTTTNHLNGG